MHMVASGADMEDLTRDTDDHVDRELFHCSA